ncbi:MAG: ABC transporter substrate-binding protein [Alphaproteobacteria bacterium]|nr:ABC transporter substrate-binding protein [Alphaproteobacteria bacterium]
MQLRSFLKSAGMGAVGAASAASVLPAPAIAQSNPEIKWRFTSSFPKSLDTLYGGAEVMAKLCAELTDGKFQLRTFAAGEIVPGLQVFDAVSNGTVEMGQTAAYYYFGKDPVMAFDTGLPFGLNTREHASWIYGSGAFQIFREFYAEHNITNFVFGTTNAQMGGWYRKEIKSVEDLKGLKFRVGGFAGQILIRLGVVPQQIAGGDIYPALEKGTIDAAEWVGPYDDEKLGFNKVAPFYYYPGWWEGSSYGALFVNTKSFNELPKHYQNVIEIGSRYVTDWMRCKYDHENPQALRRLVAGGTQLRPFPRAVLEACYHEAQKVYDETSTKSAWFKRIYDHFKPYRDDQHTWMRVAEHTYDRFIFDMSARRS